MPALASVDRRLRHPVALPRWAVACHRGWLSGRRTGNRSRSPPCGSSPQDASRSRPLSFRALESGPEADQSAGVATPRPSPSVAGIELPQIDISAEKERAYAVTHASAGTKTDTPLIETPMTVEVISRRF